MDYSKKRKIRIIFKSFFFFISGIIFGCLIYGYYNDIFLGLKDYVLWSFISYASFIIGANVTINFE